MKICTKCNIEKPLDCFYKAKINKSGLRSECKSCCNQQKTKYRLKNIDKVREWQRQHYKRHSSEVIFKNNLYKENRKKNDPVFKLRCHVSLKVNQALRKSNSAKGSSVLNHLPYTMDQLKQHLQDQFDDKMTWQNHGTYWHIDHIIPQSKLTYTSMTDENFQKCWALSNLQPLEAIANIKKGDKT